MVKNSVTDLLWLTFDTKLSSTASGSPVETSSPNTDNIKDITNTN